MSQIPKLPSELDGNLSNDQRESKENAFAVVMNGYGTPKMNERVKRIPAMKKLFNKIKKYSEYFTEDASDDINLLVVSLYQRDIQEEKLFKVMENEEAHGALDDEYERIQLRLNKINKDIDTARKNLGLSMNAKLRMANDLAKIMLEQKKIENMSGNSQPKEVNPVEALMLQMEVPKNDGK
ncbi:hypothetical protein [Cytobacillus praedii]|uniref:hypothetical protein n=1 Tax=Cytobacillus praedii TaxID=1742358 RepID=UPI002E1F4F6E|nr:hypothetical protein [Cytobacillus praedii]